MNTATKGGDTEGERGMAMWPHRRLDAGRKRLASGD